MIIEGMSLKLKDLFIVNCRCQIRSIISLFSYLLTKNTFEQSSL